MSEINKEHFKIFLEKHAEYNFHLGIEKAVRHNIVTLNESLAHIEIIVDSKKNKMIAAAKECGIEVE